MSQTPQTLKDVRELLLNKKVDFRGYRKQLDLVKEETRYQGSKRAATLTPDMVDKLKQIQPFVKRVKRLSKYINEML